MAADIGPGTRLLCVRAGTSGILVEGRTYTCERAIPPHLTARCHLCQVRARCTGVTLVEESLIMSSAFCSTQFVPLGGDHLPESLRRTIDEALRAPSRVTISQLRWLWENQPDEFRRMVGSP